MEAPPKNSVVAYWTNDKFCLLFVPWERATHYLLLEPTSDRENMFNAIKLAGAHGASKEVCIQLEVPGGGGMLVTEEKYKELHYVALEEFYKDKMWRILKT